VAKLVTLHLRQQAELGRLLAAADGYVVRTAEGDELGRVDHVRYREHADHPDQIAVRRRWFWQRSLLVSFEAVAAVDPRGTITLRPVSPGGNENSKRSAVQP